MQHTNVQSPVCYHLAIPTVAPLLPLTVCAFLDLSIVVAILGQGPDPEKKNFCVKYAPLIWIALIGYSIFSSQSKCSRMNVALFYAENFI